MSQKKFGEARAEFETALKSGGDQMALAHKYLGGIYWQENEYARAADELEKYLALNPKAPDAEKIRGTIRELRGKRS